MNVVPTLSYRTIATNNIFQIALTFYARGDMVVVSKEAMMAKEWADVVMNESERTHATMDDEEARLRKAVEIAAKNLDVAQEAYDDAVFALKDAGYEE